MAQRPRSERTGAAQLERARAQVARAERSRPDRARVRHSLESILDVTIAILDEGEQALTFRTLAARLGGGVGSIYWYVSGRDELLERATDRVLGQLVAEADRSGEQEDPFSAIRSLALAMHRTLARHPWMADYLMRHPELQLNGLVLFDRFGRQLQRLDLTTRQRFLAVDALVSYINGFDAELRDRAREAEEVAAGTAAADPTQLWRSLPGEDFPFLAEVMEVVLSTSEEEQFLAGLDLLLTGIKVQSQ